MTQLLAYQVFLKKGQSDLRVSMKLMDDVEIESDIICFHLQQFIEKYLKAFLIFNNFQPKKIHDIGLLLAESTRIDSDFARYEDSVLAELTDCGVIIRYDEIDEIDREFIATVLPVLQEFKQFIETKLS